MLWTWFAAGRVTCWRVLVLLQAPAAQDPLYDGCGSTRACFGSPAGCVETRNCDAAVAVAVRGTRYEFEMKARKAVYVAVGLSEDDKMVSTSLGYCRGRLRGQRSVISVDRSSVTEPVRRQARPGLGSVSMSIQANERWPGFVTIASLFLSSLCGVW